MNTQRDLEQGVARRTPACWACGEAVAEGDNYCRSCGKGLGDHIPWQYRHWGIIALTLAGLGPFSLLFVWRSPFLSKESKIFYTAAITAGTAFVVRSFYKVWQYYETLLGGGLQY